MNISLQPLIIIPARLGSTRLPNKPLADIMGVPMIVRVWQQAIKANIAPVLVATDSEEIVELIEQNGGNAVLTNPNHPSGSDRIYEAWQIYDKERKYNAIINVQGDMPLLDPSIISAVLAPLADKSVDIATLATLIDNQADKINPAVVKPIVAWDKTQSTGKALYFTRASAPWHDHTSTEHTELYHHIGIYAYRTDILARFISLPPSRLELREKLEQLRALENNMHIEVVRVNTLPLSVDTAEQLEQVRELVRKNTHSTRQSG